MIARSGGDDIEPGEAELLEVAAPTGNSVWRRRLRFDPIPLTGPMLYEETEILTGIVESLLESSPESSAADPPAMSLRKHSTYLSICRP